MYVVLCVETERSGSECKKHALTHVVCEQAVTFVGKFDKHDVCNRQISR